MRNRILIVALLVSSLTTFGQQKMENVFITRANFIDGFSNEMVSAGDVFSNMVKSGLKDNNLTKMDFTFISDKKENLQRLGEFLSKHYPYTVQKVKPYDKLWELSGITNEIPLTADNLLYWGLDMYKRGYEFDARIDAYGGPFDPKNQQFPAMDTAQATLYFDKAVDCYDKGDLSGALFNWSLTLAINSTDPNAYYSRAIIKNELYTWKAALIDYNKAIEIAPQFTSALINRGGVKDENGDYHGAIADYESALKIESATKEDMQQACFNLGNTYLNLKDQQKACENWKKAFELGADYAQERIKEYCK